MSILPTGWARIDDPGAAGSTRTAGDTMRSALRASMGLSLLFLVVYGGSNWCATSQGRFGCVGMDWERSLPYLPWLLLPYLSLGPIFAAAPFLCRTDGERRTLVRRLTFTILVAAIVFVMAPMELSFPRRTATTWIEFGLGIVDMVDPPHNLFPSLHVALAVVLAAHAAGWTRGPARLVAMAWFALIVLSTLLTHRHHLADVAGGLLLGGAALAMFRTGEAPAGDAAVTSPPCPAPSRCRSR